MRVLAYAAMLASALALQLSVLDTLPLPGHAAPDLVLLVVVAIALTSGPLPGSVTGFLGGLAMDLAPPASHAAGEYALVLCLVGYVCGRVAGEIDRSAFLPLVAMAVGAAGGTALYAAVGMTFGEADVTWAAARHVLPAAIAYDLILSPFVLYAVMRLIHMAGKPAEDPAAALARTSAAARPAAARPAQKEPKIGSPARGGPRWIGAGTASAGSAMAAVAGRSAGGWGIGQGGGSGVREPGGRHGGLPRMRFGQSKLTSAAPARRTGVFSAGSLTGGSPVRLRLGSGKGVRLRSLAARVFGFAPRPHEPAQPRFSQAKSGTALRGQPAAGARRGPVARLGRGPAIRFGGGANARPSRGAPPGAATRRPAFGTGSVLGGGLRLGGRSRFGGGPRFGGTPTLGNGTPGLGARQGRGKTPKFGRGPKLRGGPTLGRGPSLGHGPSFGRSSGLGGGRGPRLGGGPLRRGPSLGWLRVPRLRRRRGEVWKTSGDGRRGGLR